MANVFKRGNKWYYKFKDENGEWKTKVGSTNKADTLAIANAKESEALKIQAGLLPSKSIASVGLQTALREYERFLLGKRNTRKYVDTCLSRLEALFEVGEATSTKDLSHKDFFSRITPFLAAMGDQTANHYKAALKAFLNWGDYIPAKQIQKNLAQHKVEDSGKRRALTGAELAKLFKATEKSPKVVEGLTGRERAMLYRVAAGTGFRAQELASLRPSSFNLTDNTVYLAAGASKNSEEVWQPIHPDLVKLLAKWLPTDKDELLWPGKWYEQAAQMLGGNRHLKQQRRKTKRGEWKPAKRTLHGGDLEAAGIKRQTADGVVDFHALRVTFITELARNGTNPAIAQKLARHSDIKLTMGVYTRFTSAEVASAVPNFGA
jgi:integrase